MELKGKKINFLGDSITEGVGASSVENCFVSLIAKETGAVCRNYGIGGTRIAKQKTPSENPLHDLYFSSRVEEMDADADIVVVFGGTNDFGHGDASLGMFSDRTADTYYGGLHELYLKLIAKYPESKIVVLTPLHRANEDNPRGDRKETPYGVLKTYVDMLRNVAEYYSLPVLDLYKVSGIQPKIPVIQQTYMPDGLHPNDKGYRILADKIIKFLKAL